LDRNLTFYVFQKWRKSRQIAPINQSVLMYGIRKHDNFFQAYIV